MQPSRGAERGRVEVVRDIPCILCEEIMQVKFQLANATIMECKRCRIQCSLEPSDLTPLECDYQSWSYFTKRAGDVGSLQTQVGYADYFGSETDFRLAWAEAVVTVLSQQAGMLKRWVDIGSGAGHIVGLARRRGIEAWGVEVSRVAGEMASDMWGPFFKIVDDLPNYLARESPWNADVVSLIDVFEHLPNPIQVLRSMARHLSPNGRIVIIVPDAYGWIAERDAAEWIHYSLDHVFHYSGHALERCAEKASNLFAVSVEHLRHRLGEARCTLDPRVIYKYTYERDHLLAFIQLRRP